MERWTKLAVMIALALALPALAWAWSAQHARGMTQQQALDRAEALCHVLAPDTGSLRLTAEPLFLPSLKPDGHAWYVDGENAAGEFIIHLLLNRDTGDLLMGDHRADRGDAHCTRRPLDRPRAVVTASHAMKMLSIAPQASRWRLAGPPTLAWGTWTVTWQAADRQAAVQVDAVTGDLQCIRVSHVPPSQLRSSQPGGAHSKEIPR